MQPHGPYFGSYASSIRDKLVTEENIGFSRLNCTSEKSRRVYPDLLYAARDGYVSSQDIQKVYLENLELVMEYVQRLSSTLDGKTVITADHGERLGSPSKYSAFNYGHGGHVPEVREVPWLELEYSNRKPIISDDPEIAEKVDTDIVTEQLKQLGYL